jgi:hypothetical protein
MEQQDNSNNLLRKNEKTAKQGKKKVLASLSQVLVISFSQEFALFATTGIRRDS